MTPIMVGVVMVLVCCGVAIGIVAEMSGEAAQRKAEQASDLLLTESTLYGLLADMQTSARGYAITGDERFLEPYNAAVPRLPTLWEEARNLASELDEGPLTSQVADMQAKADIWQRDGAEALISFGRVGRFQEARDFLGSGVSMALFDSFRTSNAQLTARTKEILDRHSRDLNRVRELEFWLVMVVSALALGMAVVTLLVFRSETKAQELATHIAKVETARLETILGSMPVAVRLLTPPDGDCIMQNQAASALFPLDKWNSLTAEGRMTYFGITKADGTRPDVAESPVIRALREGATTLNYEFMMTDPATGRRRNLLGSTAPLKDARGNVTAAVVVVQDVTRMKEMDQRKDEFIATAAHELRNPLAALSGHNQLLQRIASRTELPENVTRHIEAISKQINRLNTLVERLLDTSRIQLGQLVLDKTEFDLGELAEMVATNARASAGDSPQIEVVADRAVVGSWDAIRVEQVLTNLVTNAMRYAPPGTEVKVIVQQDGTAARVQVVDRGPGVPPEERHHLFERYSQTTPLSEAMVSPEDLARPRSHQGLGLGLHISKEIVQAHGGEIGMEPNPDGGSIFWFTLPLEQQG